jgi:hypothetical protein
VRGEYGDIVGQDTAVATTLRNVFSSQATSNAEKIGDCYNIVVVVC